jgi:hypothetical protein
VAAAIAEMSGDSRDPRDVAHALIRGGLCHLRATLCDAHVIEELVFVREWIAGRIVKTREEMN